MRQADVVEAGVLDLARVAVLGRVGQRVADVRVLLVPVGAAQEHPLAVDPKSLRRDLDAPDADSGQLIVNDHPRPPRSRRAASRGRVARAPERAAPAPAGPAMTSPVLSGRAGVTGSESVAVATRPSVEQAQSHPELAGRRVVVPHVDLRPHGRLLGRHARVRDEQPPLAGLSARMGSVMWSGSLTTRWTVRYSPWYGLKSSCASGFGPVTGLSRLSRRTASTFSVRGRPGREMSKPNGSQPPMWRPRCSPLSHTSATFMAPSNFSNTVRPRRFRAERRTSSGTSRCPATGTRRCRAPR